MHEYFATKQLRERSAEQATSEQKSSGRLRSARRISSFRSFRRAC
jgi:hypothetical protein